MQECQQFYTKYPGKVVTRRSFMQVFQPAWVKGMAMSNVIGCFRGVGVYPVDRRVVLTQLETPDNPPSPKPTPFVPFCTPRRNTSAIPPSTEPPPHTPFSRVEMEYFHSRLKESTDAGMLCGCKHSTHKLLDTLQHEEVCWIPSFGGQLLQHNANHLRYTQCSYPHQ